MMPRFNLYQLITQANAHHEYTHLEAQTVCLVFLLASLAFLSRTAADTRLFSDPPAGQLKKAKKHQTNKSPAAALTLDVGDRAALDRRAQRFRREHELEKQKQNGGGGQASSLRDNQRTAHLFVNPSRSASPFVNADDPEADPVGALTFPVNFYDD